MAAQRQYQSVQSVQSAEADDSRKQRLWGIIQTFQEHLELPYDDSLIAILGAIAGERLEGPSVNIMLVGPPSCQPAGSKVLMGTGEWHNIEDVSVGDVVVSPIYGRRAINAKVIDTFSKDQEDIYEVAASDYRGHRVSYRCSGNHLVPYLGEFGRGNIIQKPAYELADMYTWGVLFPFGPLFYDLYKSRVRVGWRKGERGSFHVKRTLSCERVYGITVASSSEWYVTDDYLITHNSSKNEILECCMGLPHTYHTSSVTEGGFLSGTSKRDRSKDATGGLLMEIGVGGTGTVILTEFNTILSMSPDERTKTLGMIRDVCTGFADRRIGGEGGRLLHWKGKVQFLAGCTETIEEHQSSVARMGERFIYSRVPDIDPMAQAKAVLRNAQDCVIASNRAERLDMVTQFFADLVVPEKLYLDDEESSRIAAMGVFVTPARSAVSWDRILREVDHVHRPEMPARLTDNLLRLYYGMKIIGVEPKRRWQVLESVGLDTIPTIRRKIIAVMAAGLLDTDSLTTTMIRQKVPFYGEQTIRRSLQELEIHGIIEKMSGHNNYWRFTDEAHESLYEAFDVEVLEQYASRARENGKKRGHS